MEGSPQYGHMFSVIFRFQEKIVKKKIVKKNYAKNLILHSFEM